MNEYELIQATKDDMPWFFELNKVALGDYVAELWGWDDELQWNHLRQTLDLETTQVILIGGEKAGRLTLIEYEDHIFLSYIAFLAHWQNKGYGTKVITDILETAQVKAKSVKLSVLQPNPAIALYKRLGFVVIASDEFRSKMLWQPTA